MAFTMTMNLRKYLENGGKIENISIGEVRFTKESRNSDDTRPADKIEYRGDRNNNGDPLYYLIYSNGEERRVGGIFIDVTVEIKLNEKYTK